MQPYYKNKIKLKTSYNKVCFKIVFLANLNIILRILNYIFKNKHIFLYNETKIKLLILFSTRIKELIDNIIINEGPH